MKEFNILPVFPSVISATKIDQDLTDIWTDLKSEDFFESTADDTESVYASKNMKILDKYNNLKTLIKDTFYDFKNEVLKLHNTDFNFTSSWVTRTDTGGFCQYHSHKNAYYSGVFYEKPNNNADSGNLLFTDVGIKEESILVNDPSEWNIFNTKRIIIEPDENLLVFFPSYLRHRISKYTGTENRYSLAFNLFPTDSFGDGDSSINIKVF